MANELKLFNDHRLSASEPEHLVYIKGRLAEMKSDIRTEHDRKHYEHYSEFYGVDIDVKVVKEPKVEKPKEEEDVKEVEEEIEEEVQEEVKEPEIKEAPKKRGRPAKI